MKTFCKLILFAVIFLLIGVLVGLATGCSLNGPVLPINPPNAVNVPANDAVRRAAVAHLALPPCTSRATSQRLRGTPSGEG